MAEYRELSSALDALQANAVARVPDLQNAQQDFSKILDEVEVGKVDLIGRNKSVSEMANKQAAAKFDEYNKVQKKIVEAGPFHDLIAIFSGQPTKEDLVEEQQMLAIQTQQIGNHEAYQKSILASEEAALNAKLSFAQSRLANTRETMQTESQAAQILAQSPGFREAAASSMIDTKYTVGQMRKFVEAGTAPDEYKGMEGLFAKLYYEKIRSTRMALDAGEKDTRPVTEKLIASFGSDADAVVAAFEQSAGSGFVTAPNGQKFDTATVAKFVNTYRTDVATARDLNTIQQTDMTSNFAMIDQQAAQLNGLAGRAPDLLQDPDFQVGWQAHANQYSRFGAYLNKVRELPLEEQGAAVVRSGSFASQLAQQQKIALGKAREVISKNNGGGDQGAIAADWATTGKISSKNPTALGNFYALSYLELTTPSQMQAGGGLLLGDVVQNFVPELNKLVQDAAGKSGDVQFAGPDGRVSQGAILQAILAGKSEKIPLLHHVNSVVQKKDADGDYVYEHAIKAKYIESITSQSYLELVNQLPNLKKDFDSEFQGAINPMTGLLTFAHEDDFINKLVVFDARLRKEGKLQTGDSIIEMYRNIAIPQQPQMGTTVNLEVSDPAWNQKFDNADAQVGPTGKLLVYQMFKGTERSQVGQALLQKFDKATMTDKVKQTTFVTALQEGQLAMDAEVAKAPMALRNSAKRSAQPLVRERLLQTYDKETVDKVILRLAGAK